MKLILKLKWIFVILIITSCKEQNTEKTVSRPINSEEIKNAVKSADEIYVGKEFYSGDELINYTVVKSDEISKNDSLTYSIYKSTNGNGYIFSLEKFMSNQDQELFKIIDLLPFKNYDSQSNNIQVRNEKSGYSVSFLDNGKVLKKWEFESSNKKISNFWDGKYEGNFLRMKEESADPRAFAMIYVDIKNNSAKFKLDSYKEILDKNLLILESDQQHIILYDKEDRNSKFIIKRKQNEFSMTSNLLDETTGNIATYTLNKK